MKSSGNTVAEYYYDGMNRRGVPKAVKDGANWDRTDYYYRTSWQVVEERFEDDQGTAAPVATGVKYQYVWGAHYIDAPVRRDEDTDSDGDCTDAGGSETLGYVYDANFNVVAVTSGPSDTKESAVALRIALKSELKPVRNRAGTATRRENGSL